METDACMDAIALLTGDHNRVRGLFKQFKSAEEADDKATMKKVAPKIFENLEVHTTIEEEIFYPEIKSTSEDVKDVVAEGFEEHNVAKTLIAEAKAEEIGSEKWVAKMKVLIENVEHHAEEEEKEMFPPLRNGLGKERLVALAEKMEARKAELGAPTSADTRDLSKEKLEELASKQEIPGRSKMSQEELALTVDPRG